VRDYEKSIAEAESRRALENAAAASDGAYEGAEAEASYQLEGSESSMSEAEVQ
jgi:hypothetical protein